MISMDGMVTDVALSRPPPSVAGPDLREFLGSVAGSKEATSCIKTHHSLAYLDLHSAQHLGRREERRVIASKGT